MAEMTDEALEASTDAILDAAVRDAIPLIVSYGWHALHVLLAEHQPEGEPFILLALPDGPFVAISPFGPEAERLLRLRVPDALPRQQSAAPAWANHEHWRVLASKLVEVYGDVHHTTRIS